jgi:molybdopterin-guanine dinucleotide biosynthesis protein B
MIPLLSFIAKSGAGKTTLIEKLIPELKKRGVHVAVIKHHAHTTPIDVPGKDTWRMAQAGADLVAVSSPVEFVRFERVTRELTLAEIAAKIQNVDLILTEGFKREPAPKIEIARAEFGTDLIARTDDLIAVVSDFSISHSLPHFALDDIAGLADFICKYFHLTAEY